MKLLVTGGTGFVGKTLFQRLFSEGHQIVAPVRSSELLPKHDLLQPELITGLQDPIDWTAMLQGVEAIIHLASRVHVMNDTSQDPLAEFRKINVAATLRLAKQAAEAGVKRFVFTSSIKVNGENTLPDKPFTANDTPAPAGPYGISKHEAEIGLLHLSKKTGMEVVIIRTPLIYGPGVKANFQKLMGIVNKGIPLPFGAIQNKRSLVSLDNLVDFIIHCTHHPQAANQIFLVSDGKDFTTTALLKILAECMGRSAFLIPIPVFLLKTGLSLVGKKEISIRLFGWLQIDTTKTRNCLNWIPPNSVEESMQKTADSFLGLNKK